MDYSNADKLIERLYRYADDYTNGRAQDFASVCSDCALAADIIKTLRTSKHTQKRRRQRLSRKCRDKNKKIVQLEAQLKARQ